MFDDILEKNDIYGIIFQEFNDIKEKYSIFFVNSIFILVLPFLYFLCYKEIYTFSNRTKAIIFSVLLTLSNNLLILKDSHSIDYSVISQILVLSSYYFSLTNQYIISSLVCNIYSIFNILYYYIYFLYSLLIYY